MKTEFLNLLKINKFITKGSEAFIFLGEFLGKKVIIKERRPKKYRQIDLDIKIRLERLKLESRILNTLLNSSIPAPALIGAYPEKFLLIIEYVNGGTLGQFLENNPMNKAKLIDDFFYQIGILAGRLHELNIIHGDLTIYNIIVDEDELVLIDFGLSFISDDIEAFATDIYTFESTLRAFNPKRAENWFSLFLKGYINEYSKAELVLQQLQDILSRGRYIKRSAT